MQEFLTMAAKNIPFELTELIKERDFKKLVQVYN